MTCRIAVSIINYRTAELTRDCARSVLADMAATGEGGLDGHVVIVDNRSDDGSVEQLQAWLADTPGLPVTLVRSATNSGFSGGHNQGMAAIEADYYLILNSDGVLRPGFLAAMLAAAEADPGAGILVPRIEHEDGEPQVNCFRFAGPVSEFIRGVNTGPVTRLLSRYDVSLGTAPDPAAIDWASGACLLLNGAMVRAIGPMDEGYFLYFEDAEYCLRARRAGWRLRRVPEAVMVHFRGGSGPVKALAKARKRMPAYYYASRSRFLYQAHGRAGLLAANLLWLLGRGLTQLRRLTGRDIYPMAEAELGDIWINAGRPLGPRRAPGE